MPQERKVSRLELLVSAAAGGDQQAFRALVEETSATIYRVATRVVGNPTEAQDIVQETYVKVWQSLPQLRDRSAALSWICRICRNLATDRLRAAHRRPTDSLEEQDQKLASWVARAGIGEPSPEERLSAAESGAVMAALVASLKEKHRTVLLLREVDGMSCEEIATALGCPIGTVESRLHRARLALAEKVSRARRRAREEDHEL